MLDQLLELLKQNPLLATVYSGGIVAILVTNFSSIVQFLKDKLLYLISFTIVKVSNMGYSYSEDKNDLEIFLKQQRHIFQKAYELTDTNQIREGFGLSWYIIFGKLVCVLKELDTSNNTIVLKIKMRVFFASKEKFTNQLKKSLESATEIYENKITISFDYNIHKRQKRPLESVYTNHNISKVLKNDIQSFIDSKDVYVNNNILYKRNYLLYGKPGTGKSSLIFALASYFNFKINIIDLKSVKSVSDILYRISNTDRTFFVFEDVDALSSGLTERKSEKTDTVKGSQDGFIELSPDGKIVQGLSLSDVLNVLDGLYTAEGTICFFTTNHIEKLDSAFLRDGRMDCKIEMDDLTKEVANKMIQDKLGYNGLFTRDSINPATLQELIIQVMWKKLSIEDFINIINGKES